MSEDRRTTNIPHSHSAGMRLPPLYSVGRNWVRLDDTVERFATRKGRNEKYVRPGSEIYYQIVTQSPDRAGS